MDVENLGEAITIGSLFLHNHKAVAGLGALVILWMLFLTFLHFRVSASNSRALRALVLTMRSLEQQLTTVADSRSTTVADSSGSSTLANTLQCLDAKMLQLGRESEQMRAFIAELQATDVIPAIEAALRNVSATTEQTHQTLATWMKEGREALHQLQGEQRAQAEKLQAIQGDLRTQSDKLAELKAFAEEQKSTTKQMSLDLHVGRTKAEQKHESLQKDVTATQHTLRGLNILVPNSKTMTDKLDNAMGYLVAANQKDDKFSENMEHLQECTANTEDRALRLESLVTAVQETLGEIQDVCLQVREAQNLVQEGVQNVLERTPKLPKRNPPRSDTTQTATPAASSQNMPQHAHSAMPTEPTQPIRLSEHIHQPMLPRDSQAPIYMVHDPLNRDLSLVREASEKQRQRAALGIQATGAKANREALYLDRTHLDRWEKLSRSFLERALERMQAGEALDVCELRRLAALQHFLEVDVVDLYLPAHQRCSEDTYLPEPLCDVCVQFLMDVTRGVYVVQGTRYDFEVTLAESGLDIEKQSLEVENLKEVFSSSVAADVRRHLIESDAGHMARRGENQLVQAVTALLTQSGLANIERACGDHVIVSGGDQELYFELKQGPPRCWDLVLSCKKTNFSSFMLNSRSDAMEVLACSPSSRIQRFAVIRLMAQLQSLSVEVLEFRSEVELQNELGLPISLLPQEAEGPCNRELLLALASRTFHHIWTRSLPARCAMRCASTARWAGAGLEAKRISKKEGGIQTRDHPCSKAYDSFLECVRRYPDSYQKKCRTEAGKYLACMEENKSWKSQTRFTYMRFLEHFRLFTEGSGGREEGIGRFLYKDPTPRTHGVGTVMEFGRTEGGARSPRRAGSLPKKAGTGQKAPEASEDAGTKGSGTSE
eukprot:s5677_g3.t1